MPNTAIAIIGPTASGKTAVSLELAKKIDIEVISADSRQIYKYLNIGTAKPSAIEQAAAKQHFIDFLEPDKEYSAGKFAEDAGKTIKEIFAKGKIPVIVGGSGLYVKALCEGFFLEEKPDNYKNIRQQISDIYLSSGIEPLYDELMQIDPISAKKYSDKNPRRILRAIEFFHCYGEPISEANDKQEQSPFFETKYFEIEHDRAFLYDRINKRAEMMWSGGLIEETQNILAMGYSPELNSLNTVGYKETINFLNGNINNKTALELIKQNTRRYAKRQLTWNRQIANKTKLAGSPAYFADIIITHIS